jgi:GNAT superfamily N-acetyltransferase
VDLTIRDARPDDSAAIAALLDQLGYPTGEAAVAARLERLGVVGDRVVVAEVDGAVAGLAHLQVAPALELDRPAAKIGALVVDEAQRERGVGRALVAELEREARARGCAVLSLTTAERRADAHAFYIGVGLQETGKRFTKQLA